jgi:branched-chain amino acid transport system substrate-binding protein
MDLRKLGVLAASGVLLVAGACQPGAAPGGKNIKIAVELPFEGSDKAASDPILNGIRLAVKEAGGSVGGYTIEVPDSAVYDDAVNGAHDPQEGAKNMQAIVTDESIGAVIGPLNSNVARAQIPISNEAGLTQCSPANTAEDLTIPEFGALELRKAKPEDINYIRTVTTDDNQGPAAARFALEVLKKTKAYIIDDTETFGEGIADNFQAYWEANGGTTTKRDGVPKTTTDYTAILTAAAATNPDVIYFGGVTATGGARILKAAIAAGMTDVPYIGPDGIYDGTGATKDSFLNLAGTDAKNAYATAAAIGEFPQKAEFDAKYNTEYKTAPTGYAATGYACAQIILDAIKRAAATNPADNKALREAIRVAASDTSAKYTTVLGEVNFDENGDTNQKIISFYTFDPAGADGAGDWKFDQQMDFAAAGG